MAKSNLVEDYLIVRIVQPADRATAASGRTDLGHVRQIIHDAAQLYDFDVSDVPIIYGKDRTVYGTKMPYAEAAHLYKLASFIPTAVRARILKPKGNPEDRKKRQLRGVRRRQVWQAMRLLNENPEAMQVLQAYVENGDTN